MDFSKLLDNGKSALIAIPAMHASLCIIYILFYSMSFGSGLSSFVTPTDLFNVSLSSVMPFYVFGGAGILIGHFWSLPVRRVTKPLEADPSSGSVSLKQIVHSLFKVNWHIGLIVLVTLLTGLLFFARLLLYYILYGFIDFSSLSVLIMYVIMVVYAILLFKEVFTRLIGNVLFYAAFGILTVSTNAMSDAQRDRGLEFNSIAKNKARCSKGAVIGHYGDFFLIVRRDNSRAIVDLDCEFRFLVIGKSEFSKIPNKSLSDMVAHLIEIYNRA